VKRLRDWQFCMIDPSPSDTLIRSGHRIRAITRLSHGSLVASAVLLSVVVLRLLIAIAVALGLSACPRPESPKDPGEPGPASETDTGDDS
jgi:hypothetical protein